MTNAKAIGNRILQRRVECMLSQADLAKRLGVSQNKISCHERGQFQKLDRDFLHQIALILNTTDEYFLGLEDTTLSKYPAEVQAWLTTKDAYEIVMREYLKYCKDQAIKI